jgi:hypothetical protein
VNEDTTAALARGKWGTTEREMGYANNTKYVGPSQTAADVATSATTSLATPSPPKHQVKRSPESAGHRSMGVLARAARRDVEAALDDNGWRWNPGISRWLEVLVTLEEGDSQ